MTMGAEGLEGKPLFTQFRREEAVTKPAIPPTFELPANHEGRISGVYFGIEVKEGRKGGAVGFVGLQRHNIITNDG